jgi:NAD(P)-dependent dehydrogenase (short-subunit alcohol dehydrogenase family)
MAGLRLAGKVALVTRAGSGIGKATALLFAREGAQVLGATSEAADLAPLEQESHGLSGALTAIQMDVTREADAVRAVGTAAERYGGLDILVNNAGIASFGVAADTTAEQWQQVLDVNVKGTFLCSKHAIPEMMKRGGGAIVNNASINGIRGNHRLVGYSASKGGVVALTYALAIDGAPHNMHLLRCHPQALLPCFPLPIAIKQFH